MLRRWGTAVGSLTVSAAPTLIAVFTFGAGAALFSGSLPVQGDRLHLLSNPALPVVELAFREQPGRPRPAARVPGARPANRRGVDALGRGPRAGVAVSLLKGLDYEEAIVQFLVLGVLPPRGASPTGGRACSSTRPALAHVGAARRSRIHRARCVRMFSRVPYSDELWRLFQFPADAPRFLRATVGVAVILLAGSRMLLVRPCHVGLAARGISEATARFNRSDPPRPTWSTSRQGAALERRPIRVPDVGQGRTRVALHDPVGPPNAPGLIGRFRRWSTTLTACRVLRNQGLPASLRGLRPRLREGGRRSGVRRLLARRRRAQRCASPTINSKDGAAFVRSPRPGTGVMAELRVISTSG